MDKGRISSHLTQRWLTDFAMVYVSLHSSNPDVDDPILSEISGNGYKRQRITMEVASDRARINSNAVKFTHLPPTLITHYALWDSEFGGQVFASGPLATAQRLIGGATYVIPENNVAVSLE